MNDGSTPVVNKLVDGDWITDMTLNGEEFFVQWAYKSPTPTKIGDLAGIMGDNGIMPSVIEFDGSHLFTREWNDGRPDTDQGQVLGRWLTDAYVDTDDNVYVQYNTDTVPTSLGTSQFNGDDAKFVTGFSIDINRNLVVTYNDLSTEIIGGIDGIDARWPTAFSRSGDNFTFDFSDGSSETVAIDGFDGQLPVWITEFVIDATDPENRRFMARFAGTDYDLIETVDTTLTDVGSADGVHGTWVTDIYRVNDDFFITTNTSAADQSIGTIAGYDGIDGLILESLSIDVNRNLVAGFTDGSLQNLGLVDYNNQIESITLDSNGFVVVTDTLGNTTTSSESITRYVTDANYDPVTGVSTVLTDYSDPILVGDTRAMGVVDGVYPQSLEITNNRLIFNLSDNTSVDAGDFIQDRIFSAALYGDNNINLRLTSEAGVLYDLGRVKGELASFEIVDAFINQQRQLVLTVNDRETGLPISPIQLDGVRGADGVGIDNVQLVNSDLVFFMDNLTEINLGNVQIDFGFAPYNPATIYQHGQSCTLNGRIYVSRDTGVTSEPSPSNPDWGQVRLEGDPSPDAGRPSLISTQPFERPYLIGGKLRNYYSADTRMQRVFQVDIASGDFSAPVYEANENADSHQVDGVVLTIGQEYKWRARDYVLETGYISNWSFEKAFTVVASSIDTPVVSLTAGQDIQNVTPMAVFESTAFLGEGTHTETVWQIKRSSNDEVVVDRTTSTDLTTIALMFGDLVENTNHSVRVRHSNGTNVSEWSSWLPFKTEVRYPLELIPTVSFVGSNINATLAKPLFSVSSNIGEFWDTFMNNEGLSATWEVINSLNEVVWTTNTVLNINGIRVGETLTSGETYRVRVRYSSSRFSSVSAWSDYVSFTPAWSINAPVVSYDGDVFNIEASPIFNITNLAEMINDSLVMIEWKVEDLQGNVIYQTDKFSDMNEWQVFFGFDDVESPRFISARFIGRYAAGTWSTALEVELQSLMELFIHTASNDNTSRSLDGVGGINWTYTETADINYVFVAPDRSSYIAGVSNNVTKIDMNGVMVWQYTGHTNNVSCIAATQNGGVFTASWDNTVRKLDAIDGALLGTFSGFSASVTTINSDLIGTYLLAGDELGNVKRINPETMTEIWSQKVNADATNGIVVGESGFVACSSRDGYVRSLDINDGSILWTYDNNLVEMHEIDMNSSFIAVGDSGGNIHVIDRDGISVLQRNIFSQELFGVAIDDYSGLYVSGRDGTVNKLNISNGDVIWTYDQHTDLVRSIDVLNSELPLPVIDVKASMYSLKMPMLEM
jgi:hypothetical protein